MSQRTAVIYARVSDRKQMAEDVSIPTQLELGQKKADAMGASVMRVFKDEAKTAFKEGQRPQFEAAIEFAVVMKVDLFIVWSSARFARNRYEAAIYKRDLDRAGVTLIYLSQDIDRSTDDGWAMDSMCEIFDEMSSRRTAKDTKRSLIRNAQHGYFCGGRAPYGFVSMPAPDHHKRKRLVHSPVEAARVREIFRLRLTGMGGKEIAKLMNAAGVDYRGARWSKNMVLHCLRNESVIGVTVFNRRDRRTNRERPQEEWLSVQSHEPIIDAETWHAVQAMMNVATENTVSGSPKSHRYFTGILRCPNCDGVLQVENATGNGGRYSYYVCRRAKHDGTCHAHRLRAGDTDAWLNEMVLDRLLAPENLREVAAVLDEEVRDRSSLVRKRRRELADQLLDYQGRNRKLYDLLELYGRDAPNLGDLTRRLRENNDRIRALEGEAASLDAETIRELEAPPATALADVASTLRMMFESMEAVPRIRAFYQSFLTRIVVRNETAEVTYVPSRIAGCDVVHGKEKWRPVLVPPRTISQQTPEGVVAAPRGRRRA